MWRVGSCTDLGTLRRTPGKLLLYQLSLADVGAWQGGGRQEGDRMGGRAGGSGMQGKED